jgi:hypothetical protein
MDEHEMRSIRTIITSSLHYEPYPHVPAGHHVQVEQGALVGLTGFVTDLKSASRLIMPVDLLMRAVAIEIDRSWIKPIDDTTKAAAAR